MASIGAGDAGSPAAADRSTIELFQRQWATYRKMVEHNFLFHREAYAELHRVLAEEVARPFRFLDIACGDASASARALQGTLVSEYRGIDLSAPALALADAALAGLGCRVVLEQADFVDALDGRAELADVAWIGLSLHHLKRPQKLAYLRKLRRALAPGGLLMVYENTSRDGESRAAWLERWDGQQPAWTAFTEEEWQATAAHVHAADFPESVATWLRLGHEAGFARTRRLYTSPTGFFALYCFAT